MYWRAFLSAMRGARRQPLIQLIAIGTFALSLILVGAVELVGHNLKQFARDWGSAVQMTVYLENDVSIERTQQIVEVLHKIPGVTSVRSVDAHQAYERMRRSLGEKSDLLDGIEEGFLPSSIEVGMTPGIVDVIRSHPWFERLRHLPGIAEVELGGQWAARLERLQTLVRQAGFLVGLLVLCACIYIVGSTIRLGVFARREEIEILKLVGATNYFVKLPFLIEGACQGALGTALATGLLYGLFRLAVPHVQTVLSELLSAGALHFFSALEVAAAVCLGAMIGFLGSAIALGRYAKA